MRHFPFIIRTEMYIASVLATPPKALRLELIPAFGVHAALLYWNDITLRFQSIMQRINERDELGVLVISAIIPPRADSEVTALPACGGVFESYKIVASSGDVTAECGIEVVCDGKLLVSIISGQMPFSLAVRSQLVAEVDWGEPDSIDGSYERVRLTR